MNSRILALRKHLGLSQQEFADQIGASRGVIANIDNNRTVPSQIVIASICRVFHVNSAWLKDGADVPMFLDDDTDEDTILRILQGDDPWIRDMIIDLYHMPPECRDAVRTLCAHIRANRKEAPEKE